MSPKIAVIGLMLLATAACAPMPKPAVPSIPPAGGPEAEAAPPPVADAKPSADSGKPSDLQEPDMQAIPPTDVRTMKCSVIDAAGDDDKAYASTFLLGYRSALMHMHVIDTKRIDSILQAAVAECAAQPDALAYKVFAAAEIRAYAVDHPPQRLLHHRKLATTPAAASPEAPETQSPAAEPGPSPEPPPMRYAPAEGAPPRAKPAPAAGDAPSTSSPSEGSPK
jgi:hypothetical protein